MTATGVEAEHAGPWAGFPPLATDLPGLSHSVPSHGPASEPEPREHGYQVEDVDEVLSSPLATLTCPLDGP